MMQLPPEFRKFLSSLNRHAVDYLVIGGYAVIFHGYVRTTADIDIWVAVNPENAARVEAEVDGLLIPFLNLDDLKANKAAAGRPKDLADLDYFSKP